jgi:hypothetical protein|tara:strand:- start:314 stop:1609 length:1296 start_codon:yes stop_codon:yes gene_type:complete
MASAVLTRTPSSNGSQRIMTFSTWLKLGSIGSNAFFSTGSSGSALFSLYFQSAGKLQMEYYNGSTNYYLRTNRLFRDVNAWYHLVMVLDTTQATASNRMRIYVNGVEETSFNAAQYPTQNFDVQYINSTSYSNKVGNNNGNNFFTGQLAHVHYVDGTAYTPSTFGETDATTGIWKPKTSPTVTYGTNGFFLKMDNSANMGLDSSGQSNNLTTSGTIIQNKDTPSNVFSCLSPIDRPINSSGSSGTLPDLTNTNLTITNGSNAFREVRSTIYVTKGKYYFECKPTRIDGSGAFQVGVVLRNYSSGSGERRSYQNNGNKYVSNSSSYGATFTANDIIGVALNLTDGEITFYKNGVSQGVAATDMLSGIDGTGWTPSVNCYNADGHLNFGNGYFGTTAVASAENPDDGIGIFEYDPPAGYRAICTKSINAQEYS